MAVTLLLAGALMAQAAAPVLTVEGVPVRSEASRIDVAYEEMAQGRNEAAIARIRANRALESDDPSALINLGTAHTRLGRPDLAMGYFRSAIHSSNRYDLQLANGSWMDSRRAARLAAELLTRGETLALR